MSDFNDSIIEPFFELAPSQEDAPKQPDNPETTGSGPQTPVESEPSSELYSLPSLAQEEEQQQPHYGDEGTASIPASPAEGDSLLRTMTLHIPMRSDPEEFVASATAAAAAVIPTMAHQHFFNHHNIPQHLWRTFGDNEVDSFTYGDASTCGSGASISPASPAASWASAATSLNHADLAHDADSWHGLSPASPPDLSSPEGDGLIASSPTAGGCCGIIDPSFDSEWHCEHASTSPFDDFVGMTVNSPCPSSPVDGLSSAPTSALFMSTPCHAPGDMNGQHHHHLQERHVDYHGLNPNESLKAQLVGQSPNTSQDGPPYAQLIFRALMSRPDRCMSLQQIYQWFRDNTDKPKGGGKGWQNSIRHNLSMNRGFIKRERKEAEMTGSSTPLVDEVSGEPKRSTEWTLQDWAVEHGIQSTTRYRGSKTSSGGRKSDTARQSSPASPYPTYCHPRAGSRYGPRFAGLHHARSASAGSMRPPTSHYYPQGGVADPYRESLMHDAMMAQGTYDAQTIKRELTPTPPPGEGYPNMMVPSYHGLLHALESGPSPAGSSSPYVGGSAQPEYAFGAHHVGLGYPPTPCDHDDDAYVMSPAGAHTPY